MCRQAVLFVEMRLAALDAPRQRDRVRDEREQVLAPDVGRAAHPGVALVEERPQVRERVVLVSDGGVDVADPLRIGLQIELVRRSKPLWDSRPGDQLSRRQPPPPQAPLGAVLGRAIEHPELAERRVKNIDPRRRADRHPAQILIADLLQRPVTTREQQPQPEQRRASLVLGAGGPLDPRDRVPETRELGAQRIVLRQPPQPLGQPRARQHHPAGPDRPRQHERRRAPGPAPRRLEPLAARVPDRPALALHRLPTLLQRPLPSLVQQPLQRARRPRHLAPSRTGEPQRGEEAAELALEPLRVIRRIRQRGQRTRAHRRRSASTTAASSAAAVAAS